MGLQMRFLGIIEGLEQRTLIDRRACITDIRNMKPYSTDFLNKVLAVLITAAEPAVRIGTAGSGAILSAQRRRLDLASHSVFTGVKGIARLSIGDLNRILADLSGNGGRILVQLSRGLLE